MVGVGRENVGTVVLTGYGAINILIYELPLLGLFHQHFLAVSTHLHFHYQCNRAAHEMDYLQNSLRLKAA